jgi:hypothetical protein
MDSSSRDELRVDETFVSCSRDGQQQQGWTAAAGMDSSSRDELRVDETYEGPQRLRERQLAAGEREDNALQLEGLEGLRAFRVCTSGTLGRSPARCRALWTSPQSVE